MVELLIEPHLTPSNEIFNPFGRFIESAKRVRSCSNLENHKLSLLDLYLARYTSAGNKRICAALSVEHLVECR